jgi:glycosyltransferase involved in cell wall biosynthesis
MARPPLLFLAHLLPFPPDSGAAIRTYNILRLLAGEYEVTALCFFRRDPIADTLPLEQRVAALSSHSAVEAFAIPQQHSRPRLVLDHLRSVLRRRPYTYYVHDSREFIERLQHHLQSTAFELVHVDSLDLVRLMPFLGQLPVVCTHHNVESALLRRRALTKAEPLRSYMRLQASLVEREERRWLPRVKLNIAVSPADEAELRLLAPGGCFATIPNGVDVEYFRPAAEEPQGGSVFVGGTNWFPNRAALDWFAAEILPEVRRLGGEGVVQWVGHATSDEQREFSGRFGLELTGYVNDIRPYVHEAKCFVVPLTTGGGTRLKILDAWAMGKAVVSTSVGCEGLATVHGENILIADTAEDFAKCVVSVLTDAEQRRRLGAAARRTVEERYSWDVLGRRVAELYHDAAQR